MARALKGSWINEYSNALADISESPHNYNIWAAISVVGSVLKNNVFYKRSTYTIYPNNYIIFVGPPGIGKGAAIRPAYDMAEELGLINLISDRITAPKIIEKISKGVPGAVASVNGVISVTTDCSSVLQALELPTLLTGSDWMLPFLCQAWDQDKYSYDTKNAGTNTIKGLCCSIIGGCVPDYIRKLNKDITAAISGGFTARAVFVYADCISKKIMWPKPLDSTPKGRKHLQEMKTDLQHIATIKGEMTFTHDGALAIEQFYAKLFPKESDSDITIHFKSRLLVHLIKTSMIFCVAENDSLQIDAIHVTNAITCLRHIAFNLDKAFRGVGDSDIAESVARIQSLMEKRPYISRNEILAALHKHINSENLERCLAVLVRINFCTIKFQGGQTFYQYIPKKRIFNTDLSSLK